MLRVNILSNDKDIIIKLPKSSHEMAAELRKAGIDISPERLTLKSNVGHNYLIGYTPRIHSAMSSSTGSVIMITLLNLISCVRSLMSLLTGII